MTSLKRHEVNELLDCLEHARRLVGSRDPRLDFALRHHRSTRGARMDFDRRPYLLPIYMDRSRGRVFQKCVQCGISEMLVIDVLEAASRGLACLYVMPTQDKRDTFVANRVGRILHAVPRYEELLAHGTGRVDNLLLKHFGKGALRFVGSNVHNEFVEFPADLVIVDELDQCTPANLPLVRDRIAASEWKLEAYASTPTFPDSGIARIFETTDAKEWLLRCPACTHWQRLDFFANVVRRLDTDRYVLLDSDWSEEGEEKRDADRHGQTGPALNDGDAEPGAGQHRRDRSALRNFVPAGVTRRPPSSDRPDVRVFCVKCGRPLDRLAPGEWVPKHPGREASGYHLSELFVPTVAVSQLWGDWQAALRNDFERQRFWNSMLGLPFAAEGSGISLGDLAACTRDYELPPRAADTTMGVDVGEWFHVRISEHPEPGVRRAVFIGRVKTTEELDALVERFGVRCCVIDATPEVLLVRKWQLAHPPGLIWRCAYTDNDLREFRKDTHDGLIHVARTPSLDDATEDVRMARNHLPRNIATLEAGDYARHMTAPVRTLVADPQGNKRYVWTKPAADHYRHADNYDKIASQLWRPSAAARPVAGPAVRTFPRAGGRLFKAA